MAEKIVYALIVALCAGGALGATGEQVKIVVLYISLARPTLTHFVHVGWLYFGVMRVNNVCDCHYTISTAECPR